MIDLENFNENFKYYGKQVVCEIIDIFAEEYPDRMISLQKSVADEDFDEIKFNAHSLKGVIVNFMDPEPIELARKLEEMGENKTDVGLTETFEKLRYSTLNLLNELKEYRKTIHC
jgi:HPt (histidine-containing phosphotransfer) domain-containing protein